MRRACLFLLCALTAAAASSPLLSASGGLSDPLTAPLTLTAGASGIDNIGVQSLNGFSGSVSLSTSGYPGGTSDSLRQSSVMLTGNGSAGDNLAITTDADTPPGYAYVSVTGTSNGITHTTYFLLTIDSSNGAPPPGSPPPLPTSGSFLP